MGKYCAYPACQSGRTAERSYQKRLGKRPASIFKVPKHMVQRWSEALRLQLSREHFVCELHFPDESIIRVDRSVRPNGVTEMVTRSRHLLVHDAVPIAVQNKENINEASSNISNDLPGPSIAPSNEPIHQSQNTSSGEKVDGIQDDTARSVTDGDDDDQSQSNSFADHLSDTTSESAFIISPAYDDTPDVPSGNDSDATYITLAESISDARNASESNNNPEEQAANNEGGVCTIDNVIDRLKQTSLPESWCWTMIPRKKSRIVFIQIDRYTFQPRMKVFLHNDLSITIQAFDSEAMIKCRRIMSSVEEIVQFLRRAENGIVCCGVGFEDETRAENCFGFVGVTLYTKFVQSPRCIACRERRKVLQTRRNRRKRDVRAQYVRLKRMTQLRQRECRRLEEKLLSH